MAFWHHHDIHTCDWEAQLIEQGVLIAYMHTINERANCVCNFYLLCLFWYHLLKYDFVLLDLIKKYTLYMLFFVLFFMVIFIVFYKTIGH